MWRHFGNYMKLLEGNGTPKRLVAGVRGMDDSEIQLDDDENGICQSAYNPEIVGCFFPFV